MIKNIKKQCCQLFFNKMGNQATKVTDEASKTADSLRKRLTIRRRRPETVSDFSEEDIKRKYKNIPKLSEQEKSVLKSSWAVISKNLEVVSKKSQQGNSAIFVPILFYVKLIQVFLKVNNCHFNNFLRL